MAFVALYDATALRPASLRDLLIRLAQTGLFQAKWTHQILDEMIHLIVRDRPELGDRLERTRYLMNKAIPDVNVSGYQHLVPNRTLADPSHGHVLGAAIRSNAQVIVTANPGNYNLDDLDPYDIEPQSPDQFVLHVLELAPARVVSVIEDQARALATSNHVDALVERLNAVGLPSTAAVIRHELGISRR